MNETEMKYGIVGYKAPELASDIKWIDGNGQAMNAIKLSEHQGKFIVLFGFQSWCPGCHSSGFPSLLKMVDALKDNEQVVFFAMQTVFEGAEANTKEKLLETQQKYKLAIPFGQDEGNEKTGNVSSTMYHYRTGGTPWFVFIDQNGVVVFNDFHLNEDAAIEYLKKL